jgi:hypothetical protein
MSKDLQKLKEELAQAERAKLEERRAQFPSTCTEKMLRLLAP